MFIYDNHSSEMGNVEMKNEKPGFITKFFDKSYEKTNILELTKAPVASISGISESDAQDLKKAFGIETVEDLANNKYVKLAQGINSFAAASGTILDKEYVSEGFQKLALEPVSAISGISKEDAALLKKAFGIDTIKDLAENKYVGVARATMQLAAIVAFLSATTAM